MVLKGYCSDELRPDMIFIARDTKPICQAPALTICRLSFCIKKAHWLANLIAVAFAR